MSPVSMHNNRYNSSPCVPLTTAGRLAVAEHTQHRTQGQELERLLCMDPGGGTYHKMWYGCVAGRTNPGAHFRPFLLQKAHPILDQPVFSLSPYQTTVSIKQSIFNGSYTFSLCLDCRKLIHRIQNRVQNTPGRTQITKKLTQLFFEGKESGAPSGERACQKSDQ